MAEPAPFTRPARDGLDRVRRLHSLSGGLPLVGFALFHAWQQSAVRAGRDAMLARLDATGHGVVELLLVVLPLLLHAGCALWLLARGGLRPAAQAGYASPAFRRFQAITGLLTGAFLCVHVLGVWHPFLPAGRAFAVFGAMLDQTGTPLGAAGYVVGISATCVHLGQGLSVFLLRLWPGCSPRLSRTVGGLVGGALWLAFLDELAVYATGAALM
ncbi:MAG: hypothetical protein QM778_11555 [Myxococcales bacterium]